MSGTDQIMAPRDEKTVDRIFAGSLENLPPLSSKVFTICPTGKKARSLQEEESIRDFFLGGGQFCTLGCAGLICTFLISTFHYCDRRQYYKRICALMEVLLIWCILSFGVRCSNFISVTLFGKKCFFRQHILLQLYILQRNSHVCFLASD